MATAWTTDAQVMALMRLPWTVRVERDECDGSLIARVDEVPDAIGTGDTEKGLAKDLWDALWASLEVRVVHGDVIPLPRGARLPWLDSGPPTKSQRSVQLISARPEAFQVVIATATA